VHRPARHDWSFPKGKIEPAELTAPAAVREVAEETGYRIVLGRPLPTRSYDVDGLPKQVRYWAARGDESHRDRWAPDHEVDAVEWLPAPDAADRLTYPHDRALVSALDDEPLETVPLVVVRHGKAVKRAVWQGTVDAARPLEPRGVTQARRLVPLLAAYGVRAVRSSGATRCRDTVLPYARAHDLALVEEPALSEEGHHDDPAAVGHRADALLATPVPTVVCTHRPVLPDLLESLLATAPRSARKPSRRPLSPAGVLVLHRDLRAARPRVVAVERHTL
jgi:8-oxo-dGTP diphosphatase